MLSDTDTHHFALAKLPPTAEATVATPDGLTSHPVAPPLASGAAMHNDAAAAAITAAAHQAAAEAAAAAAAAAMRAVEARASHSP